MAEEGFVEGFFLAAEIAVETDQLEREFVAGREGRALLLQAHDGEVGVAAFPVASGQEELAFEAAARAASRRQSFLGGVVVAAVVVGLRGLQGEKLVRAGNRPVFRGQTFFNELDDASRRSRTSLRRLKVQLEVFEVGLALRGRDRILQDMRRPAMVEAEAHDR